MFTFHGKSVLFTIFCIVFAFQSQAQNEVFLKTQIGSNNLLDKPWDLLYGPEGYLWVTERVKGTVLRINPETAQKDELIKIADVSSSASQDGLLGMALHSNFTDSSFVFLSYTHLVQGQRKQKIVRYLYEISDNDGSLSSPVILIDNLPASNDHNSGRLIFGPDEKLYYTIGDQGGNQGANYCNPILSQINPSQQEINQENWSNYPGKILRLNLDGSIPEDNPIIEGVQSHIYSYGHRNVQGIVFGTNGKLYADEHGPNTDDEVNLISAGNNYGWPNVVGYKDDQAYDYCNWSSISNCQNLNFNNAVCPSGAIFMEESSFVAANYKEPLMSMFAVSDDYNYDDPNCSDPWICRPNVAPSSLAIYESEAIPSWKNSLLVVSLKRGRIYRLKLDENGEAIVGDTTHLFYSPNRYRDMVMNPDGRSFYLITDRTGKTSDISGHNVVNNVQNPGSILKFTLDEALSVKSLEKEANFNVWPNPVQDVIHLELKSENEEDNRAELINSIGQVVRTSIELHQGINEIKFDKYPAGVYFIRVYSKDRSYLKRIFLNTN